MPDFSALFLVNAGQYQNVELTISGETLGDFQRNLLEFNDNMKQALGVFHAEFESHFKVTRQGLLDGTHQKELDQLIEGLGAKVVSEEPVTPAAAWNAKREPTPKPWDTDDDDGFEDF